MSEIHSSQRRQLSMRDSSVTQIHAEVPLAQAIGATDDQATVISSRPLGSSSDSPPLLPPLEVGKLLEGEQLGQFELRQFVGGGGMGVVFRGWDTTLNREVAVKVLSRDQSTDEESLRRFRNEAQSAARLDHPNIARVYGMGEDRGVNYIIFEFIEGVNLRDLVDRHGPLPLDEAIDYTLQVAEALDHASQRDVIHRDIKPSNVLITAEGNAKVVDMGLARLHQVEQTNDDLTASGVTLGTFDYISPEQARDPRSADVRSDLYSLGCSLYFMLVGQPPFPNGTVLQKLLQHQGDAPPDPRKLRHDLPAELIKLVSRLLAKAPAQRHQSPAELIGDLSGLRNRLFRQQQAAGTQWSIPKPRVPAILRRHAPWALPLLVLLATSLALDLYWTSADRAADLMPVQQSDREPASIPSLPPRTTVVVPDRAATKRGAVAPKTAPISDSSEADRTTPVAADKPRRATPGGSGDLPGATKGDGVSAAVTSNTKAGLLIVGDADGGATHPTLEEAIRSAASGDVIELRFDGVRDTSPIKLDHKKLTIRAAENFAPTIHFVQKAAGQGGSRQSMCDIDGGNLTLMHLAIEFDVPTDAPGVEWVLFNLRNVELLRLERCSITVGNPWNALNDASQTVVAAANHADAESTPESATAKSVSARQPINIELQNCIVRGEAMLARIGGGSSARVVCDNSLIAIADRVLDVTAPAVNSLSARFEFEARHLTLDTAGGLLSVNFASGNAENLAVDLRIADSILRSATGTALIQLHGLHAAEAGAAGITWSGNRNFYEGIDIFWDQQGGPAGANQLRFADWKSFWGPARESLPQQDAVVWDLPIARDRRASESVPADFKLSTSTANNPARDASSDGLDAGCLLQLLPSLP